VLVKLIGTWCFLLVGANKTNYGDGSSLERVPTKKIDVMRVVAIDLHLKNQYL